VQICQVRWQSNLVRCRSNPPRDLVRIDESHGNTINKLYYRKPTTKEDELVIYSAAKLSNDEDIIGIILCRPKFPTNTIIELFVTFLRSPNEILRLLQRTSKSSSADVNHIERTWMIFYFGGHFKWVNIVECPYRHSLMFKSEAVVYMTISHNCIFVHLLDKISHGIGCGDHKQIIEISYRHAVKVVNNFLFHDIVEIKCNSDIVQMIQRLKDV